MSGLDEDYRQAGFGGCLAFGARPALLAVDMVNAYLDPACPLYAGDTAYSALDTMVRLRKAAHAAGLPVILTGVSYQPGGADGGLFYRKVPALSHFDRGNPFADFPDRLRPQGQDITLLKQYPSAFFGTPLASMLVTLGVDTLLIGGYSTSGCVRATALDAMQHGFAPFIVREACADRDSAPHEASLFDLQAKYAEVVGLSWTIEQIRRFPLPA